MSAPETVSGALLSDRSGLLGEARVSLQQDAIREGLHH